MIRSVLNDLHGFKYLKVVEIFSKTEIRSDETKFPYFFHWGKNKQTKEHKFECAISELSTTIQNCWLFTIKKWKNDKYVNKREHWWVSFSRNHHWNRSPNEPEQVCSIVMTNECKPTILKLFSFHISNINKRNSHWHWDNENVFGTNILTYTQMFWLYALSLSLLFPSFLRIRWQHVLCLRNTCYVWAPYLSTVLY